jgi:hypothetical protein
MVGVVLHTAQAMLADDRQNTAVRNSEINPEILNIL